ncbi:MAG: LysR family transcriptional regulator [Burkholderiaceae bacterium]|jgi:DNA-binding transcriptional LysR family regulator|nr:LysR family transcriptional regulator [Burkholderiaceae bacterium]
MSSFLRRLSLRQLTVFLEAARQMSFARAAESLHLTQPAISMQIRLLEDAVGLPLFDRIGKRLALTQAGELLRHHAARALGELQDAEQAFDALKGLRSGHSTVGLVSTAKYFTPRLLARFAGQHPEVDIQFLVGNRETLIHALRDNEIDFAVMGRPPDGLETVARTIAENPHVLVAHKAHRLAKARGFDFHELREETFLMREPGSGTRLVMEALFKQHLFTPKKTVMLGSNETVKQAVMADMGISLLSLHSLELELRAREVALLDVMGTPVRRNWHIVHMQAKKLAPAAAAFHAFLCARTWPHLDKTFARYAARP